ncbi:hypothetical protein BCR44DRAFT_1479720 [Catenaria anguillulae PL171]|uniref:Uncharacterized protein n=1 Tax=Catenaria anguillulae PL171 TaxID=765915 RepID=A0A1Y2HM65_9FUNG|nr:hypothetical protein BCR44DRAFT_1479720 [Catenaria anguillulae PL171]
MARSRTRSGSPSGSSRSRSRSPSPSTATANGNGAAAASGNRPLVDSPLVATASLHASRPRLAHYTMSPFLYVLYPTWVTLWLTRYDMLFGSTEATFLSLLFLLTCHALTLLAGEWNVSAKAFLTTARVASIQQADTVRVIPPPHSGSGACASSTATQPLVNKPVYGTHVPHGPAHLLLPSARTHGARFGKNEFHIPVPTFAQLFKEHAIAPFFVFQVFCVSLWALDEYWYYSLFTLAMLAMFESTVVGQRVRTLQEFRSMTHPPRPVLPRALKDEHVVPCDAILISGAVVVNEAMLSGESTPLHKESIALLGDAEVVDDEVLPETRMYTVYAGTKVVQATPPSLVRMMVFSSERVSANNLESFLFIGFLLIFAFAAAGYVWVVGQQHGRPTHKLLLDCILIVTSVVPPELPMELSMAVNTSLMALSRLAIFCTEPFRIPFAGKLDVLCFDKTGTITTEDLVVEGIAGIGACRAVATSIVVGAAHALVRLDDGGSVIGDPMERATVGAFGWSVAETDRVVRAPASDHAPLALHNAQITILRKFAFSSALKRMSTIARVPCVFPNAPGNGKSQVIAAVKGAPETLLGMLRNVPAEYVATYKKLARNGGRVLALGFKVLDAAKLDVVHVERSEMECDLTFAGFLVFSCPLKPDSAAALKELSESGHRCTMITGDAALTAVHVAKQVDIVSRECLILDGDATVWRSPDELVERSLDMGAIASLVDQFDLCVTGVALDALDSRGALAAFGLAALPYVYVWARVSPAQKEWILTGLKAQGFNTLMCGDGTNDVGALKQAHVGVALLDASPDDLMKIAEHARYKRFKDMYDKQVEWATRFGQPAPPRPTMLKEMERKLGIKVVEASPTKEKSKEVAATGSKDPKKAAEDAKRKRAQEAADKMADKMMKMTENLGGAADAMDEAPTLKFGDASVAAPFTSKLGTLVSISNVIKQGRCTLVTTLQMYKILALNCLISAYAMSVLFLDGMKWGDWQMTIQGMLMAACFFFISRGQPVERLAEARPLPSFFNAYALLSVVGQFAVHAYALYYVTSECKAELGGGLEVDFEGKKEFVPNLLNAGVYLITTSMQVSTFAINYIGRPFRESIRENVALFRGLVLVGSISFLAAMEVSEALNEWLQLVPFPGGFADKLTAAMALDFVGAYVVEWVFHKLLARSPPRPELRIVFGSQREGGARAKVE